MSLPSDIDPVKLRQRLDQPAQLAGPAGSMLTVQPGHVGDCAEWDKGTAKITWKVDPKKLNSTRIEVNSSQDSKRQVFSVAGASGEAVAEGWFSAGVKFHLVDGVNNVDLVTYTVDALPCVQQ